MVGAVVDEFLRVGLAWIVIIGAAVVGYFGIFRNRK